MKYNFFTAPAIVCLLVAFFLGVLTLGPFMRETDQGWLLDGGMAIAKGHTEIARAEFNFDKQFVSYYLIFVLDRCLPRPFAADTLVYAGNFFGLVFFWGALWLLLARSASRLSFAVALPVVLTPAFLDYSPFYASAFTSAALVFLLAWYLDRREWNWPLRLGIFLLSFLAVGARADAMFVMPLLAMLHSPRRTFTSAFYSWNTWLLAGGGLTAFVLGRVISIWIPLEYAPMTFHLNQYLGYVVFGLGATTLVLLAGLHAVLRGREKTHRRTWIFFLFLALALPMTYYSFQLLSPRHCVAGAISVAVFICSRRGRAIFQSYFRTRFSGAGLKLLLVGFASFPLLIGFNLTDLRHPKISFLRPTLLPSAAGVAPAGANFGFLISIQQKNGVLDHNQPVWNAVRATKFTPDASGTVPFVWTPMESYLRLAIHLQNQLPRPYNMDHGPLPPPDAYCETRSLMRLGFSWTPEVAKNFLASYRFVPVSPVEWQGITVVQCRTNAPDGTEISSGLLWALNERFGANEFRMETGARLEKIPADWAGKKITLASPGEIHLKSSLTKTGTTICCDSFGCWHVVEISPATLDGVIQFLPHTNKIFTAVSAFPAWMLLPKN